MEAGVSESRLERRGNRVSPREIGISTCLAQLVSRSYRDEYNLLEVHDLYGGIITTDKHAAHFDSVFDTWRQSTNMRGELKWVKVSRAKLDNYKSAVDLFFEEAKKHRMHFKVAVFPTQEIDYATYHKGSQDLGFYKFYYQFLLHKFGHTPSPMNTVYGCLSISAQGVMMSS